MKSFNRKMSGALVTAVALMATPVVNAAVDVSAATAGIADAQTASLTVLGLLLAFAAAVFAVRRVIRLVK